MIATVCASQTRDIVKSDAEHARFLVERMLFIRSVEEEIVARYRMPNMEQQMRCPVHLSIGQEAAAVGACAHLTHDDAIFSTHRCHAHYLAKGGRLLPMVLEIYGKQGGCLDGRGGSMHLMDHQVGMVLSVPIVSSSIPLAVGHALANKIDNKPLLTLSFFGDAAVEEGVFHESMNFATLKQLPMIFVCENNLFSVYTPLNKRQPYRALTDVAVAHQMEAIEIDGNDVFTVSSVLGELISDIRQRPRPVFIVLNTYRYFEHCGVDNDNHLAYRDVAEYELWKQRDPVYLAIDHLLEAGIVSHKDMKSMHECIKKEVRAAFDYAESAPLPTPEMAKKHVYAP